MAHRHSDTFPQGDTKRGLASLYLFHKQLRGKTNKHGGARTCTTNILQSAFLGTLTWYSLPLRTIVSVAIKTTLSPSIRVAHRHAPSIRIAYRFGDCC